MSSDAVEAAAMAGAATSYWCYRCSRLVRVRAPSAVVCPDCETGFVELVETPPRVSLPPAPETTRLRSPAGTASAPGDGDSASAAAAASRPGHPGDVGIRHPRRAAAGDRSPFNPVIVLRGPSDGGGDREGEVDRAAGAFELYYDDGAGLGLRPLPASMSDFLMGAGFDRLLDQLAQIELNGVGGRWCDQPPASKAAVESMPTVQISEDHVGVDAHCAVCKEPFQLGMEAREMPCKHIYHQDCILPWLSLRNSCPVCRHELPTDVRAGRGAQEPVSDGQAQMGGGGGGGGGEEDTVGLTIWRLPRGGFAVGRFSGGRRAGERELPVVFTEMDGAFSTSGAPRRNPGTSRGSRSRESGGVARAVRRFFSFFGRRFRRSSSSSSSLRTSPESGPSSSRIVGHVFGRNFGRRGRGWSLEDGSATGISR